MKQRSSWRRKDFWSKELRRIVRQGAKAWDETGRNKDNEKLWNWARSNATKLNNLLNDWETVLALAVENGWKVDLYVEPRKLRGGMRDCRKNSVHR